MLVLRPEPGASETARRARDLGLEVVAIPLFEVEPVAWAIPAAERFDALLLTSANAVRCAGEGLRQLRALPAHAVGAATADAAREAGLAVASRGDDGVDGLLESLPAELALLHLCGEHRRAPRDARHKITAIPVYRAKAIPRPELADAKHAVALIHSPRAGERFAELVGDRSTVAIAAISAAAAAAVGAGWERVDTAAHPTDDALLALAARLCNISAPQ
jgi:uroporphyrinogen-III synthase